MIPMGWGAGIAAILLSQACVGDNTRYKTFADYPGFEKYYSGRCPVNEDAPFLNEGERELPEKFRPRLVVAPGGRYPIDFYADYLPYSVARRYADRSILYQSVTPELLRRIQDDNRVYLDFQFNRFRSDGRDQIHDLDDLLSPAADRVVPVYGRIIREDVTFPVEGGEARSLRLVFLKYSLIFAVSGSPARLPAGYETVLRLAGLDPEDLHEVENVVDAHVVLDEFLRPIAVILAQHNHHRTYLLGRDLFLPEDGRLVFDIAVRSNEIYPASSSSEPVERRVIRWGLYMKYLLSGEDAPFFRGTDVTYGLNADGREIPVELKILSPCDPFYTAKIMLGEPRPFLGRYIGRDGPLGADYYALPPLVPLGNLLKASYLRDGDPEDIRVVEEAIQPSKKRIDFPLLMAHGGRNFYQDFMRLYESRIPRPLAVPDQAGQSSGYPLAR